jgi:2-succinyl-5-enolpyruvyl-6-hydroxy-3-cyclohexene-1-carboxylate synthase
MEKAPNLNYVWAGLLVEELVRSGVTCFCIAPGSRSSPLTVSAARHPKAETVIHYDERGLAFYALGRASVTKQPVALICSSGTAAVNFFPAVVEGSKKKLPLVLLTADRPPELRNTGSLQTIDQVKLYGNYVRWHTDLPAPDLHVKPEVLLTTVDQALFLAKNPMPGPVHINCMFREPLAPDGTGFDDRDYLSSIKRWMKGRHVYTRYTAGGRNEGFQVSDDLVSVLNNTRRGIIVVGKLRSTEEEQAVVKLAEKLNWPVFPDIVSGLRLGPHESEQIIHYYDQALLSTEFARKFPVDTVLHLGGRITSKRWYRYVQTQKPEHYITVLAHSLRNDPLHIVSQRVKSTVQAFARSLLPRVQASGSADFLAFLREASQAAAELVEDFIQTSAPVNEIGVAHTISRLLPEGHSLFLSNSMPVRDMDMYAAAGGKSVLIGANRGASGIDGIVATTCGFTAASGTTCTLLTGDLALLHDLNSLALVKTAAAPIIIVVINNDGGGIFSFLPIAESPAAQDIFDTYFGTPHGLRFSSAAAMFGLEYSVPETTARFEQVYKDALKKKKSIIIEVNTGREENHRLHSQLQKKIEIRLDKMLQ